MNEKMKENKSSSLLLITELFLPTKGGTSLSLDDDFRRLGGKEVHIITADVPGAKEFDREHPNSIYRLTLKRHLWMMPESLMIYIKLFYKSLWLTITRRVTTIFSGLTVILIPASIGMETTCPLLPFNVPYNMALRRLEIILPAKLT